ncbi:hypothetical protein ACH4U5_00305 [Streptomyces sp. NPDC020858]|uniref:hypothetical protein n=1 Tax=Streptomyces sp. NPDC020858 TaxID=3365097 RepID=UPI00379E19AF
MIRIFRTRRLVLLAASTAIAAGGVLVPTTAFAAAPASAHTAVAESDHHGSGEDRSGKWGKDKHDKWGKGKHGKGKDRPGKGDSPAPPEWQCVRAPCGPPSGTHTGE